jgi:hypothetical protein
MVTRREWKEWNKKYEPKPAKRREAYGEVE